MTERKAAANKGLLPAGQRGFSQVSFFYLPLVYSDRKRLRFAPPISKPRPLFKFGFYDFVLFVGYTYTHATNNFNGTATNLTLTPRHSVKGDLLYALPGKWRLALDYEYKSGQYLSNGTKTRSYWTFGALVEYTWKNYTFFGNVENYTNVRQTNFGSLVSAPNFTPQFTEVWAPLDGIVFNTGIKIRL